jgi:hypothetical protein
LITKNIANRSGGAICVFDHGELLLDECLVEANHAEQDGGALHVVNSSVVLKSGTLLKRNTAAETGRPSTSSAESSFTYQLPCPLGRYIPAAGEASVRLVGAIAKDFPYQCGPGLYGDSDDQSAQSRSDCKGQCPLGKFCPVGTIHPKPCGEGRYCEGSDETGTLGATAALPCVKGTFSNETGLTSAGQCAVCPAGSACATGSTQPTACLPGTYAAKEGQATCVLCDAGKFASVSNSTACEDCTQGSLCVRGSSAPQPCPGGTHANQTVLNATGFLGSLDECIACPAGTSCSVGSAEPKPCLPGSFAEGAATESCTICSAGEYQDEYGQVVCKRCTTGFYCEVGTAKPTPCPAGTASNVTGLSSADQCIPVEVGFWAPLGSALPEVCPETGFYCPGAAEDQVNDIPGSKPIIMPVGGSTEQVPVMRKEMTLLQMSCAGFERANVKAALAAQYGVPPELVDVPDPCPEEASRRARALQSGDGLSITITIATSMTIEDGTVISGPNATELLRTVEAVSDWRGARHRRRSRVHAR